MTTSAFAFQTKVDKAVVNMDRLDQIVNGDPATVVTTDAGSVPSFAKLQTRAAIATDQAEDAADRAEAAAGPLSSAVDQLNRYSVLLRGDPVVDRVAGVIRYPEIVVSRNGSSPIVVSPSSYTVDGVQLQDFAVPITLQERFHYLNLALIGTTTASPVKSALLSAIPTPSANVIPLGVASQTTYTSLQSNRTIQTKASARVDSLLLRNDVVLDLRGIIAGDGVSVVYVPRVMSYRLDGTAMGPLTVANTASAEMPSSIKFALDATLGFSIYYDPAANAYATAIGNAAIPVTGTSQSILVFGYNQGGVTFGGGARVIDYTASLGENQSTFSRNTVDMPRRSPSGSGPVVAVPLSAVDTDSATALSALGLVAGVARNVGSQILVGDYVEDSIPNGRAAAQVLVHSTTGTFPAVVNMFLADPDGNAIRNISMNLIKQITPNLRSYAAITDNRSNTTASYMTVGPVNGVAGARISLWGAQFYFGPRAVLGIWPGHYPAADDGDTSASFTVPDSANKPRQRRLATKLGLIEQGANNQLVQVGLIGDSMADRPIYAPRVRALLQQRYGAGGTGFVAFADTSGVNPYPSAEDGPLPNGGFDIKYRVQYIDNAGAVTSAPTWTSSGWNAPVANLVEMVAAAAGARLRVTATGAQINTRGTLLYRPIAGSSIRYSWDLGATWTTINTASGYVALLAGLPASGTWTLDIQDTGSARAAIDGLNLRKAVGFVLHNVAVGGSRATQWAAQSGTAGFQAHMGELGLDEVVISVGANDRDIATSETVVGAAYDTIGTGVRAALPYAGEAPVGLLYFPQCENLKPDMPFPYAVYTRVIYQRALAAGAAFLDMDPCVEKAAAWFEDDLGHPTVQVAGPAIARALVMMLDR